MSRTDLHSTDILDLDSMTWIQTGKWDRHIGTYRAIATTSNQTVKPAITEEGGLVGLSWSEKNNIKNPEPLLLFSNFNFTQYAIAFIGSILKLIQRLKRTEYDEI